MRGSKDEEDHLKETGIKGTCRKVIGSIATRTGRKGMILVNTGDIGIDIGILVGCDWMGHFSMGFGQLHVFALFS